MEILQAIFLDGDLLAKITLCLVFIVALGVFLGGFMWFVILQGTELADKLLNKLLKKKEGVSVDSDTRN